MGVNGYMKIGTRIKQLRKEKGLKQKELADILHIPLTTFASYETGYAEPSLKRIVEIASALDVSVAELFQCSPIKQLSDYSTDELVKELLRRWL